MLQLTDISKAFVKHTVLENVDLRISEKSRIGLIGRNGCGKSTLLKIMMGQIEPDSGSIYKAPGLSVNCLSQEPQITPGNTLEEELRSVFSELNAVYHEEAEILKKIESLTGDAQIKAINRLDKIHQEMHRLDAQNVDSKISRMVTGLGFTLDELHRKVELFSGGWQMRINLAKVLLVGADILLLDEPTNHLDLEACEWLENFLINYPGGIVVVSHDRKFLDKVITEVAEVELGHLTLWTGNYSQFVTQKEEFLDIEASAVTRQQKELAKQTAFVERFRASATKSTQAKSREKQLAKIERLEVTKTNTQRISVRFPVPQASGKQVLTIRNISKAYNENALFSNIDGEIERGQRIFLLGANGCGKTTLLRLILGLETPDTGEIKQGHNVLCGYFSQHQLETLDSKSTAFDTLHNTRPDMDDVEIRGLLGGLLFTGEQVFKPISTLSGGEKSRVALARLMLTGPNTLLLDEPTNHMDISAKEVLEAAFKKYDGSILCISHDRYFIQQLATDIWEIHQGQLLKYPGGYDYYLDKRDEIRSMYADRKAKAVKPVAVETPVEKSTQELTPLKQRREIEKQITKIEKSIISIEAEIEKLQKELDNPALQQDYQKLQQLSNTVGEKQKTLHALNAEWEALTESLA